MSFHVNRYWVGVAQQSNRMQVLFLFLGPLSWPRRGGKLQPLEAATYRCCAAAHCSGSQVFCSLAGAAATSRLSCRGTLLVNEAEREAAFFRKR
jgi:hypothetical protein